MFLKVCSNMPAGVRSRVGELSTETRGAHARPSTSVRDFSLGLCDQLGGLHPERTCQFRDRADGRLVLTRLDEGDEISLNACL